MKVTRFLGAGILFLFLIPGVLLYLGRHFDAYMSLFFTFQSINLVGIPIILAGFLLSITSIWQLYSYGSGMPWGDVSSDSQSSRLVTEGLYRYTRNPMLLGFGLFIMGFGLVFRSFSTAFLSSPVLVILVSLWIKKKEEPELVNRFGQEYIEYRNKTPFLIPRKTKNNFR